MMIQKYPRMNLYSKNAVANAISGRGFSYDAALRLIDDCVANKDRYWRDNLKESKPESGKWVRDASRWPLGTLLKLLNERMLAPYDKLLPAYVYGGVTARSNKDAARALLGVKRKRIMLKMDMSRFYEHILDGGVVELFQSRFGCSKKVAELIAYLTCVEEGQKAPGNSGRRILGRGFSTSGRIATWCNLDLFNQIFYLMKKYLDGCDPRMSIYMDDIGITASRVPPERMAVLYYEIVSLVEREKANLEINEEKTKIVDYLKREYDVNSGAPKGEGVPFEFVGVELLRNKLREGVKVRGKISRLRQKSRSELTEKDKKSLKGMRRYVAGLKGGQ